MADYFLEPMIFFSFDKKLDSSLAHIEDRFNLVAYDKKIHGTPVFRINFFHATNVNRRDDQFELSSKFSGWKCILSFNERHDIAVGITELKDEKILFHLIEAALFFGLLRADYLIMHASGFATKDGGAELNYGLKSAGKTKKVLDSAHLIEDYFGDEYVIIDKSGYMYPFIRPLNVHRYNSPRFFIYLFEYAYKNEIDGIIKKIKTILKALIGMKITIPVPASRIIKHYKHSCASRKIERLNILSSFCGQENIYSEVAITNTDELLSKISVFRLLIDNNGFCIGLIVEQSQKIITSCFDKIKHHNYS